MRKLIFVFIFLFAFLSIGAITHQERAEFVNKNLLANNNPGFENSTAKWTKSGGTFIVTPGFTGNSTGDWDSNSASQTLTSASVTIPGTLYGKNGIAYCKVQNYTGGTLTTTMGVSDGTNTLVSATLSASTAGAGMTTNSLNFIFPSSGSVKIVFTSVASDEPEIFIDDCYIGEATNINQVSQAQMYGGAKWTKTTNCVWSTTSSTWGNFSADADCTSPTGSDLYGNGTAPATKVPGVTFTKLPPGEYVVRAIGTFEKSNTANMACGYRIHDGTTASQSGLLPSPSSYYGVPVIEGRFSYTTAQGSTTFQVQGNSGDNTSTCNIDAYNNAGNDGLTILVYYFPSSQQTSFNPDEINWFIDVNISGAQISLGTSDQTSYVEMTNSGLTLTNNSGSSTAQIACASGTASTGTTCSVNESNGIAFNIPKSGVYQACAEFTHYYDGSSGTGTIVGFQIVETTNTSSAVVQEGKSRTVSYPGQVTSGTASLAIGTPVSTCGLFTFSSSGQKTIRLEYEQDINGAPTTNVVIADAASTQGQPDIHWTVRPWLLNTPAPNLVNSVLSNTSGQERIERATFSCGSSGSAITTQSGSWVSIANGATGTCSLSFTSGMFSAVPSCVLTSAGPTGGGNFGAVCYGQTVGTTTALDVTRTVNNVATNGSCTIICMGAK